MSTDVRPEAAQAPTTAPTPPTPPTPQAATEPVGPPRRRRVAGFGSIQSKLLVMLLLSSIVASTVVGVLAYRTGADALRGEAYERLAELRDERARALDAYFSRVRSSTIINSRGIAAQALPVFDAAYDELRQGEVDPQQRAKVTDWYTTVFVPELQKNADGTVQPESFVPSSPARTYLQATYTAAAKDFDEALTIDDPGDGSAWTQANKRYQPFFRQVILGTGADDIMLVNAEGDIVWTAYKGADLGSNIKRGEYRGGGLEQVFDAAIRSNSVDFTAVSDLELYQPSYNNAAAFVASPITDADDKVIGAYIAQIPITGINAVLTGSPDGASVQGLGETGETVAAGKDAIMRSNSRLLIEDPEEFRAAGHHARHPGRSRPSGRWRPAAA